MSFENTVLLDFYSDSCYPCKLLMKDLESMTSTLKGVEVKKLNIMENLELANKYNVKTVPTLIVLRGDNVHTSYISYKGKEDLRKFLSESL